MASIPEYDLGPKANAFRQEVRDWLTSNWQGELRQAHEKLSKSERGYDKAFVQQLAQKGWLGISLPEMYGGQARSSLEQMVFIEELTAMEAPALSIGNSCFIVGPSICAFGTEEQKKRFVPEILSGDVASICLGYSEPNAGSDLASLRTKAMYDGDDWIVDGQKIWCSGAEHADYIWLAARTDPEAIPKHSGISVFLVPMQSPGITIEPSMAMYGKTFSTVQFDRVRVPGNHLIGKANDGWRVITHALAYERVFMGGLVAEARLLFDELVEHIRGLERNGLPLRQDQSVRERIGALAAELEVARLFALRSNRIVEDGKVPTYEAAMSKIYTGELRQRIAETALEILGTNATLSEESATSPLKGKIEYTLCKTIMEVVGGGTNEIQRNIIAIKGLGLPR